MLATLLVFGVGLSHGAEYVATPTQGTWQEMSDYCESNDMILATFSTPAEVDAITQICAASSGPGTPGWCYLGYHDSDLDQQLEFVDGEVLDHDAAYALWHDGEPELPGPASPDHTCGCMYSLHAEGYLKSLWDCWCTGFTVTGICEIPSDDGCTTDADYNVQIIIDESGSVNFNNVDGFGLSISFVKDLIENKIAPGIPVSVSTFGTGQDPDIDRIYQFSDDQSQRISVLMALDNAAFNAGGTPTKEAIQAGIDEYQDAIDNDLYINDGERLMFLLTDGVPTSGSPCSLKTQLDALDIRVIILGVGTEWNRDNVECLADDADIHVIAGFTEEDFGGLLDEITETICPPEEEEEIVVAPEPLNCKEAQEYCKQTYGTQLATIATDGDRDDAIAALQDAGEEFGWIGLYSDPVETKWRFRSGDECPSDSAYKCVDFWLENPGGEAFRPRCIGPSEDGHECAVFYRDENGVNNDVPTEAQIPFLCDTDDIIPL